MWCQPINLDTTLMAGESFEVFYRKFPDLTWIPYLPNPLTSAFDICGLPDGNYELKARRVKADGTRCKEASATFTVGEVLCIGILPITYDLPNAQIGVPYNVEIPFAGSLPASISGIVSPAWMTVSIVGTNIVLSGLPTGVALTDVDVEFTIDNCAEVPVAFADTINVTAPASGFAPIVTSTPNASNPVCYDDVQIDFNTGNSNFTYDIELTGYVHVDQQHYDGVYPGVNLPPTGTIVTKSGGGSPALSRLRATTGGGGGSGSSGFDITITEFYLGNPTGLSWSSILLGTLNNRTPC